MGYNDNAAAFTWEIVNDYEDLGNWNLFYLDQEFKGSGFESFLSAAKNISNNVNVVYVKKLNWFIHIARKFIDFSDKKFFANGDKNFYQVELCKNVEVRGWDNFWDKVEDGKEFLKRLDACRSTFRKGLKRKLGLENHYKTTLAKDMWDDIKREYHLYTNECRNLCRILMPQDQDEFDSMNGLSKAAFYYSNPDYFGELVTNLHSYDISSSHIGLLYRKRFPSSTFKRTEDIDEIQEILNKDFYCYHGSFSFYNLHYRKGYEKFSVDLGKMGMVLDGVNNRQCWVIYLTNIDRQWFKKVFEWDECYCDWLYYAEQKALTKDDYVKMVKDLYEIKSCQKKGTFAKEISKFRAELPFGQSIKKVFYETELIFNQDENDFEEVEKKKEISFLEIQNKLIDRGIPMYYGLWIVSYSRLEFFEVVDKIGIDKVVYGDTDSVKFIGDEGIKVIEEHNAEIDKTVHSIEMRRNMPKLEKIGRWLDEGDIDGLKAIGIKWYATLKDGEVDVKASGADPIAIKEYLQSQTGPLYKFNRKMKVEKMFFQILPSKISKYGVNFTYINKMDNEICREINSHGTRLVNTREEIK